MNNIARLIPLAIAVVVILVAASLAQARDRLDPAYRGGDVHVCRGLLTSSGTCIGSESNVEPDSYEGIMIYRRHSDYDRDGEHRRRHRRDDDED